MDREKLKQNSKPLLIIDADDTLWRTQTLYTACEEKIIERLKEFKETNHLAFEPNNWVDRERTIDRNNFKFYGLSPARFPLSCRTAAKEMLEENNVKFPVNLLAEIEEIAETVFFTEAPLIPNVQKVLLELREKAILVLLTQGDRGVQERRIKQSGLRHYFDSIYIVLEKTSDTFINIANKKNIQTSLAVSIGNSLSDDIEPARQAGMKGISVSTTGWEHKEAKLAYFPGSVLEIEDFGHLTFSDIEKVLGMVFVL